MTKSQHEIKKDWCDAASMSLAIYYQFNAEIDGKVHPRVLEVTNFLFKNMETPEDIKKFVTKIKSNCNYFPKYTDLSSIYTGFKLLNQTKTIDVDLLEFTEKNDVPLTCPEENSAATIDDILNDDKKMAASELLKKYGVKKCGEAWKHRAATMTDKEYNRFINKWTSGKRYKQKNVNDPVTYG